MTQAAPVNLGGIGRGFADPVMEAQAAFKAAMWASARPGLVRQVPLLAEAPVSLSPAAAAILLALADFETPLWLAPEIAAGEAGAYLRFHSGAPIVSDAGKAMFALVTAEEAAALLPLLSSGDERYPDRSASLLIDVPALQGGRKVRLSGPGIRGEVTISPAGLGDPFWRLMSDNHRRYPLGVDCFLCCGQDVIGLPRSIAVSAMAEV